MKIGVLSGKGGTGKTTVSTNLSALRDWQYVDCDVEEPNGFIFLQPDIEKKEKIFTEVPEVNESLCIGCKKCTEACEFNSLAYAGGVIVFEQLCHGCGACGIVCPTEAITYKKRAVGVMKEGYRGQQHCIVGTLNVKEAMGGPVIQSVKKRCHDNCIIDLSPGTACNVVKGLQGLDYALLVTEPTAFGLHDLKLAVNLVKQMSIPYGIIINRATDEDDFILPYIKEGNHRLLGIIPYERDIASLYAKGQLLIHNYKYRQVFMELWQSIDKDVMACN